MTPEYGATSTLFPIDNNVLDYLRLTGRDDAEISFVEAYARAQGVFGGVSGRTYARVVELNLSEVELSLARHCRHHQLHDGDRPGDDGRCRPHRPCRPQGGS